jgi:mRNA interferase MazF
MPLYGASVGSDDGADVFVAEGAGDESVVSCDNILTVPTSTLGPRIGYLQPSQELELAESIRAAFDLI